MRRRLEIELTDSPHEAYVKGSHGVRELLTDMRGRPPLWATGRRAWVTTEKVARDLCAVAESRGWDVTVTRGPDLLAAVEKIPHRSTPPDGELQPAAEPDLFGGGV